MKTRFLLTVLPALVILISSCGSSKNEKLEKATEDNTNKMLKMHVEYSDYAKVAAADLVLNDDEILKLNQIGKKIENFSNELEKKYEKDTVAQNLFMNSLKKDRNIKIIKDYNDALMLLYKCEGSEYLL